jgi:hypothetical protein
MKSGEYVPDTDSDDRSVTVTLGAVTDKGVGLTARDNDVDFERPRNKRLRSFSHPLFTDMAL